MKFQLIRSATIKLYYDTNVFLIDPYFAEKFSLPSFMGKSKNPTVDLPLPIDKIVSDVDYVCVSHLHTDHFHLCADDYIDQAMPIICQNLDRADIQSRGYTNIISKSNTTCIDSTTITQTVAQHGYGDILKEMGEVCGFYFESENDVSIYWVGDSVLSSDVKEFISKKSPDVIIVHPCGATWEGELVVMDEKELLELCELAPNSKIIATHMDSLDHANVSRSDLRKSAHTYIQDAILYIPEDGEIIEIN